MDVSPAPHPEIDPPPENGEHKQNSAESCDDTLRNELQRVRKEIVNDIRMLLVSVRTKNSGRSALPRDLAALEVIRKNPTISARDFCRAMNARQDKQPDLGPPPGWGIQFWTQALSREHRERLYQYIHRKKARLTRDAMGK